MNKKTGYSHISCFNDSTNDADVEQDNSSLVSQKSDQDSDFYTDDYARIRESLEGYVPYSFSKNTNAITSLGKYNNGLSGRIRRITEPTTGTNHNPSDTFFDGSKGIIPDRRRMKVSGSFSDPDMVAQNLMLNNLLKLAKNICRMPNPSQQYLNHVHLTRPEYMELHRIAEYVLDKNTNSGIDLHDMDAVSLIRSLNGLGYDPKRDTGKVKDAIAYLGQPRTIDGSNVNHRREFLNNIFRRLQCCLQIKTEADRAGKPSDNFKDPIFPDTIPANDEELRSRCGDLIMAIRDHKSCAKVTQGNGNNIPASSGSNPNNSTDISDLMAELEAIIRGANNS